MLLQPLCSGGPTEVILAAFTPAVFKGNTLSENKPLRLLQTLVFPFSRVFKLVMMQISAAEAFIPTERFNFDTMEF